MNSDNFKPDTVYTIYIAATPEKVWQALTTAEFSRQYFFGFAVEIDSKVGGSFIVRAPDGSLHIDGEVLAYDPPRKLSVTWNVNWPGLVEQLGQTIVTYEIAQAGDAVRLTMTEIARARASRRYSFRRPHRLARNSFQPQERAGNRQAAGGEDGAAAENAGGAEGDGDRDAVSGVVSRTRCGILHAASQSRDRTNARVRNGPGSAAHRVARAARCAASGDTAIPAPATPAAAPCRSRSSAGSPRTAQTADTHARRVAP